MSVGAQTLGPKSFHQFLFRRGQKKAKAKRSLFLALSLTSMVDMFSLLVIFLLQSFSASPELIVTQGIQLPNASTGAEIKDAPVIAVTQQGVFVDQKFVGKASDVLTSPPLLMKPLAELRKNWQKRHPTEKFLGEVHLQADKDLESSIVSQIMGFLPSEHYGVIQLGVVVGSL